MNFVSTRGNSPSVDFSAAMSASLAPDGGLYVPKAIPLADIDSFLSKESLSGFAGSLLRPFLECDPLQSELDSVCQSALNFPAPLKRLDRDTAVLELFHGPTSAFKDFGARFLAECAYRIASLGTRTVLVATSGDTGGAVASAFHDKPGIRVVILYPKGRVSARQEKQLNSWGPSVHALAVRGDFDDCQRLVKRALSDPELTTRLGFISANSINIGRLLPQMAYFAMASLRYQQDTGRIPGLIVPSGNLGNALAALYAKKMGFPIRQVIFATNENIAIADYLRTGVYEARPTIPTLANAMDVGNPSNVERLIHLYPEFEKLRQDARAVVVGDREISETIENAPRRWGEIVCPHTASGFYARERLGGRDWIITATAHPAKFETIVEPLIGEPVPVPRELQEILERSSHCAEIGAEFGELWGLLMELPGA